MSRFDHDLVVIGAGSAGVRAARIAAGHGARVAVVEEFRVGGTCVIRGCVPKKLLHYGAGFAEDMADAARFGWTFERAGFSWPALRQAVADEVARLEGLYRRTLADNGIAVLAGTGRIIDANTVQVAGHTLSTGHILVATGARPRRLDVPGAAHAITSNEVFGLAELPPRVAIIGGGYIANEFASLLHAFGAQVTLINRGDTVLRGYDVSLRERLLRMAGARGIGFRFDTRVEGIEADPAGGLRLDLNDGDVLVVDQVLAATGRVPNTAGLGLDAVGVELDDDGAIRVDAASRTCVPSISAVGDVTNRLQLTPVAIREGQAFADRLFGGIDVTVDYDAVPSAVFTSPPLAAVGLTEAQARSRFDAVKVYASEFRPMRHALAGRDERAYYKLVVDAASDRVLGAHLIGPDVPEILQVLAIVVKAGLTKAQLDAVVALHPTMAEELVLLR